MDNFVEQIIIKKADIRDVLKRLTIVLAGSLVAAISFILSVQVLQMFIVLALGSFYLMYYLLTGSYTEYEYIVTNNELDIDKISGKRKRKRLITVKINTAEQWCEYDKLDKSANPAATVAAHDNTGANVWCLLVSHEKHGKTLLVFSPNSRVKDAVNKAVPYGLRRKDISDKSDADNPAVDAE